MADMTKYLAKTSIALKDGRRAIAGEIIELADAEARKMNKVGAIGLYLGEDDEAEEVLPKPKPKAKRRAAPAAPKPLDDADTVSVDPRAR